MENCLRRPPCTPLLVFVGAGSFAREEGPVDIAQALVDAIEPGEIVTLPKPDDISSIPLS